MINLRLTLWEGITKMNPNLCQCRISCFNQVQKVHYVIIKTFEFPLLKILLYFQGQNRYFRQLETIKMILPLQEHLP